MATFSFFSADIFLAGVFSVLFAEEPLVALAAADGASDAAACAAVGAGIGTVDDAGAELAEVDVVAGAVMGGGAGALALLLVAGDCPPLGVFSPLP